MGIKELRDFTAVVFGLLCFFGIDAFSANSSPDPVQNAEAAPVAKPVVTTRSVKVEGKTLYFTMPDGVDPIKPLETQYSQIEVLGMTGTNEDPYVVLLGLPCDTCTDNKSVFFIRARGGKPSNGTAITLHHPGSVRDRDKNFLLHQSRLFFGKCLASRGEAVVIFAEEKVDRRKFLQRSLFIAEPREDRIKEELLTTRLPSVTHALHFVKMKKCVEVKGYDRPSIPFTIPYMKKKKT